MTSIKLVLIRYFQNQKHMNKNKTKIKKIHFIVLIVISISFLSCISNKEHLELEVFRISFKANNGDKNLFIESDSIFYDSLPSRGRTKVRVMVLIDSSGYYVDSKVDITTSNNNKYFVKSAIKNLKKLKFKTFKDKDQYRSVKVNFIPKRIIDDAILERKENRETIPQNRY